MKSLNFIYSGLCWTTDVNRTGTWFRTLLDDGHRRRRDRRAFQYSALTQSKKKRKKRQGTAESGVPGLADGNQIVLRFIYQIPEKLCKLHNAQWLIVSRDM